jgi:hypothetical protein
LKVARARERSAAVQDAMVIEDYQISCAHGHAKHEARVDKQSGEGPVRTVKVRQFLGYEP